MNPNQSCLQKLSNSLMFNGQNLYCRSGKLVSSAKPMAAEMPVLGLESPFKASSQEALPGELRPENREDLEAEKLQEERQSVLGECSLYPSPRQISEQQAVAPNCGRGGEASSSDEVLQSSKDKGLRFQTRAVGRRFNSSGVAETEQVSNFAHSVDVVVMCMPAES